MNDLPDPFLLMALLAGMAMVPFIVVMVTSFAKIVIVLFLIRNALGIQQIPPNIVLHGIAIVLTVYIMMPVTSQMYNALNVPELDLRDTGQWADIAERGREPLRDFLVRFTNETERAFFLRATEQIWPPEARENLTSRDLVILIPAFTVSELTKAFEIGFLLYLPFIAIDLIVSNILLAMGMMMVSPLTISLPFKLFLFVVVDGWTRLIHGLVLSYA
jgi:type III secretion protein R